MINIILTWNFADDPDISLCEANVLLEELRNVRKDQQEAYELQKNAFETLKQVLDKI